MTSPRTTTKFQYTAAAWIGWYRTSASLPVRLCATTTPGSAERPLQQQAREDQAGDRGGGQSQRRRRGVVRRPHLLVDVGGDVGAEEGGEEHRLRGHEQHHAEDRAGGAGDRTLVARMGGNGCAAHASAPSAWAWAATRASYTGRFDRTGGSRSKLWAGGGEGVAHSSVKPSHGSAGALRGLRRVTITLTRKTRIATAITKAPRVASELRKVQPRSGA